MQPMVSAGKLFEPKLHDRDGRDGGATNDNVLEPTYERHRDGPRITLNNDEDNGDDDGRKTFNKIINPSVLLLNGFMAL